MSDINAVMGVTQRVPTITRDPTKLVSNSENGAPVGDLLLCRVIMAKEGQVKHDPVNKVPRDTAKIEFQLYPGMYLLYDIINTYISLIFVIFVNCEILLTFNLQFARRFIRTCSSLAQGSF